MSANLQLTLEPVSVCGASFNNQQNAQLTFAMHYEHLRPPLVNF